MNELGKTTKEDVTEALVLHNVSCSFTPQELTKRDLKLFNFAYEKGREWGAMGNCLSSQNDWLVEAYKELNL